MQAINTQTREILPTLQIIVVSETLKETFFQYALYWNTVSWLTWKNDVFGDSQFGFALVGILGTFLSVYETRWRARRVLTSLSFLRPE